MASNQRPSGNGQRPQGGQRPQSGQRPQGGQRPQNGSRNGYSQGGKRPNPNQGPNNINRGRRKKKNTAIEMTLKILGYVLCVAMFVLSVIVIFNVIKLRMLPKKYVLALSLILLLFIAIVAFLQKWITSGIITKILSILMIILLVMANWYITYTYKKINSAAGITTKVDNVNVYVMASDPAQSVNEAAGYTFGILKDLDRPNTNQVLSDLNSSVGSILATTEYNTTTELVAALYSGEVKAIVMNSAYESIVESVEDYVNFKTDTRVIISSDIESEIVEKEENVDYLNGNDEVFTIYVSGIDTRGSSPKVNSNSDVNILLTANLTTRQILLISTPRDFYIPLSISNGNPDKLTHAGGYGIDVSVATLENLYGVNVSNYLKINFTGFIRVVDALGGITVNSDYAFTADNENQSKVYKYQVGDNYLNGEAALGFARERHAFSDGDRQRGKNQMKVIEAIINKLASTDTLKNYNEILDSISDCMVTSMPYEDITNLIQFQLNDMRGWDIVKCSVTGADASRTTYSTGDQAVSVMIPDQSTVDQAKEYLRQIYNGEIVTVPDQE